MYIFAYSQRLSASYVREARRQVELDQLIHSLSGPYVREKRACANRSANHLMSTRAVALSRLNLSCLNGG